MLMVFICDELSQTVNRGHPLMSLKLSRHCHSRRSLVACSLQGHRRENRTHALNQGPHRQGLHGYECDDVSCDDEPL